MPSNSLSPTASFWQLVCEPTIVRRALKVAALVGTLLLLINHGEAVWNGELDGPRLIRIGLTYLVPYAVSTFSSVQARLEAA